MAMFSSMLAMASGTQASSQRAKSRIPATNENTSSKPANSTPHTPQTQTTSTGTANGDNLKTSLPAKPVPGDGQPSLSLPKPLVQRKIVRPTTLGQTLPRSTVPNKPSTSSTVTPPTKSNSSATSSPHPASRQDSGSKKMSFKELMRKANSVDGSKITVTVPMRRNEINTKSAPSSPTLASGSAPNSASGSQKKSKRSATPQTKSPTTRNHNSSKTGSRRHFSTSSQESSSGPTHSYSSKPAPRGPIPAARPSAALQERLNQRRKERDEEFDSELDDFVVHSDDEEEPYYRAEISKVFGRSYRIADDDLSDTSDMEATGADILNEEQRSQRLARMEDAAEERRLAEYAERKRRRKAR